MAFLAFASDSVLRGVVYICWFVFNVLVEVIPGLLAEIIGEVLLIIIGVLILVTTYAILRAVA